MNRGKTMAGNTERSDVPLVMALMVLFLSIGAMAFVSYVKSTTGSSRDLAIEDVCVSCALLDDQDPIVKPLIQSLMTEVDGGYGKKCCVQSLEDVKVILELVSKASSSAPASGDSTAPVPLSGASAVKKLHPPHELLAAEDVHKMIPLGLTPDDDTGELSKNVLVTPHGIIILHTGLYHVHLSVKMNSTLVKASGNGDGEAWSASVIRSSFNNRPLTGTILKVAGFLHKDGAHEENPVISGGYFMLLANDHIHVEMSAQALKFLDKNFSTVAVFVAGGVPDQYKY